jgi:hypothetical protein
LDSAHLALVVEAETTQELLRVEQEVTVGITDKAAEAVEVRPTAQTLELGATEVVV